MKLNFASVALALALPTIALAQNDVYPNTFSSGSANVSKFTQKSKRFNDWAISAGVGLPLVQSADLTSIKNGNGKNQYGYSAYFSVDKAITHAFGLNLQYDTGETKQGWGNADKANGIGGAKTQYHAISLLGDINFSNLLRRVDNHSPFRWAFHGYVGVGTLAYKAYHRDEEGLKLMTQIKPFNLSSLFTQAGAGVKYKVSRRVDIEGRLMYVVTGDDSFDGGGAQYSAINLKEDQISDNFFNATLGVTVKLGKHQSHLFWHDPLQELEYNIDLISNATPDVETCKKGDRDNDGVCDDWDRQLDTPAGARVDGAGVALDTDLDGVIDLYDKCVTVPGPVENNGCPNEKLLPPASEPKKTVSETVLNLEGVEFALNSDKILSESTPILQNAVNYINSTDGSYKVIGATDTRASEAYNQKLSERRANAVKNYLIKNGVQGNRLEAEGRGEKDLKYPECEPATKCPEWKNKANRRVYFEAK